MEAADIAKMMQKLSMKDPMTLPGNADQYAVSQVSLNPDSPLKGKEIFFLGSSITYGAAANGESFVDYLVAEDGIIAQKEAISGTTLADKTVDLHLPGINLDQLGLLKDKFTGGHPEEYGKSYLARLNNFDSQARPDLFVVQLSTNDGRNGIPLGKISSSKDPAKFDQQTTLGAIEYLCAKIPEQWHCPLAFYTCLRDGEEYQVLIQKLKELQIKWAFQIIDLGSDPQIKAATHQHPSYMADDAHPTRQGYRDLWTPYFREALIDIFS